MLPVLLHRLCMGRCYPLQVGCLWGGRADVVAAASFWAMLSLSFLIFSAVSARFVEVDLMLVDKPSSFLMIGRRDPLAPSKRSWMSVETSSANLRSVKSVSKMEMEQMASSKVLGIFYASVMCNNAVARLLYQIGCCVWIRFLASRKLRASISMWIEMVSGSVC